MLFLQIATCRSLLTEFPDGETKYAKFKDAVSAGLLESSSSMEAAFECSRFPEDLIDRITKLFSPPHMVSVLLYKEAPKVCRLVEFTRLLEWPRLGYIYDPAPGTTFRSYSECTPMMQQFSIRLSMTSSALGPSTRIACAM